MTIVDKNTFNHLVKNPSKLGIDVIPQLEATIKAFPYCQISYSLLAKAASISGSEELDKTKPLAAAYALSRIALQNLVESQDRYDGSINIEEIVVNNEFLISDVCEDVLETLTDTSSVDLITQRSEEQKKQQQIIQGFMKKNPRIIRQESNVEPVSLDIAGRVAQSGTGMIETEAFAKILLRQGKTDKAIDVYQKLILRNPEKRNYFAKKLNELYHSEP